MGGNPFPPPKLFSNIQVTRARDQQARLVHLSRCCVWQWSIPVSAEKENTFLLERCAWLELCAGHLRYGQCTVPWIHSCSSGMAKFRCDSCGNFSWAQAHVSISGAVPASAPTDETAHGMCPDIRSCCCVTKAQPLPQCQLCFDSAQATFSFRISASSGVTQVLDSHTFIVGAPWV